MGRYSHRVGAEPLSELDRYFAERANAPFGDLELASGRALQPFSIAGQRAASNLLVKASRALDSSDPGRARAYVDRAVRMPYDRHEESHPAAMEAHMALFCLVTDALEDSGKNDSAWLEAAIEVLSAADERGRCTMRDVLAAIDQDYELRRQESGALRSAIADIPVRPELRDLRLDPQELGDCVMSALAACRDYRAALRPPH